MLPEIFRYISKRIIIRFYVEADFLKWRELFSSSLPQQNQWDWDNEPLNKLTQERYLFKLANHFAEKQSNSLY